jgi:hypothetical protein
LTRLALASAAAAKRPAFYAARKINPWDHIASGVHEPELKRRSAKREKTARIKFTEFLSRVNAAAEVVYCPPDFIQHTNRDALRELARTPLGNESPR